MTTEKPKPAAVLRADDLKPCSICDKPLLEGGPVVYRVQAQQFVMDLQACQRAVGFEMMIGAPLARAMGPDEPLALAPSPPETALICGTCFYDPKHTGKLSVLMLESG